MEKDFIFTVLLFFKLIYFQDWNTSTYKVIIMDNNVSLLISSNGTNITENYQLDRLEFAVGSILIPVFTSLGLVGNVLSVKVLLSPGIDMKVKDLC